jgi:hypothetical protein
MIDMVAEREEDLDDVVIQVEELPLALPLELPAELERHRPALLQLKELPDSAARLEAVQQIYRLRGQFPRFTFRQLKHAVFQILKRNLAECPACQRVCWSKERLNVQGNLYCAPCAQNFPECRGCHVRFPQGHTSAVMERPGYPVEQVCIACYRREHYSQCYKCGYYFPQVALQYHDHRCHCVAPHAEFAFPRDGGTAVGPDERFVVQMGEGQISEAGMGAIRSFLRYDCSIGYVAESVASVLEPVWQTAEGNFPKRLAKWLYQNYSWKLTADQMARLGVLARDHSATSSAYTLELTRDVNGPAQEFVNASSCWWQSMTKSRCIFKTYDGIAMRAYGNPHDDRKCPRGRAWILSLDEHLTIISDPRAASAFLVFNGYGSLQGYVASRLVAQMARMTYKKIEVDTNRDLFYTNGDGYLVGPQEILDRVHSVSFAFPKWDKKEHTL